MFTLNNVAKSWNWCMATVLFIVSWDIVYRTHIVSHILRISTSIMAFSTISPIADTAESSSCKSIIVHVIVSFLTPVLSTIFIVTKFFVSTRILVITSSLILILMPYSSANLSIWGYFSSLETSLINVCSVFLSHAVEELLCVT